METIKAIKPGPKPRREDGKPDERRRVNPETKPKYPGLKSGNSSKFLVILQSK